MSESCRTQCRRPAWTGYWRTQCGGNLPPSKVGSRNVKSVQSDQVFFTCQSIPFDKVMSRWCEVYERLRPALNMILGLRYAPFHYLENNLLTAVGAAEILHRNMHIDKTSIPAAEFRTIRKAMLNEVPKLYRGRISELLRNDPTLRERLLDLASRPDQEAVALLVPDVDRWARATTKARNNLTHEGQTHDHSIEELAAITDVTAAIVILNLLNEVGLPVERQRAIIVENAHLQGVAERSRRYLDPKNGASVGRNI